MYLGLGHACNAFINFGNALFQIYACMCVNNAQNRITTHNFVCVNDAQNRITTHNFVQ